MHPPRRSVPVVLAAALALWIPYIVDGGSGALAGRLAAQSVLVIVVGFVLGAILFDVRSQRLTAERTGRLARMDALTGLGNRLAFDESLGDRDRPRPRRDGSALSIGIADLDDLKGINDRFGHLEGDRCIREAARAIELSVRMTDRCFRWGGDEFVIVLPGTDRALAEEVLGRMAMAVAAVCETEDRRPVTLTYGSAENVRATRLYTQPTAIPPTSRSTNWEVPREPMRAPDLEGSAAQFIGHHELKG